MITCCTRDSILFDRKESKLAVLGGSLVKHLLAVMNRPEDYYFWFSCAPYSAAVSRYLASVNRLLSTGSALQVSRANSVLLYWNSYPTPGLTFLNTFHSRYQP